MVNELPRGMFSPHQLACVLDVHKATTRTLSVHFTKKKDPLCPTSLAILSYW